MACSQNSYASSQKDQVTSPAEKGRKHKVVKGDTWYSIAKKYAVPYEDLRKANNNKSDNLRLEETVLIPFVSDSKHPGGQKKLSGVNESSMEAVAGKTHKVKSGENLSLISKKYSVTVTQIMEWNKLSSTTVKAGQKLVVGVEEKKSQKEGRNPPDENSAGAMTDTVVKPATVHAKASVPGVLTKDTSPEVVMTKPVEMIVPEGKPEESFVKGRKEITEEGTAAWIEDQEINPGKYFALHRTAAIGTIVKVTNRMNQRIVFVKVVGKLPDTGENESIVLKISKAAAEKLGVLDARFQAQLNYGIAGQ